MNSTFKTLRRFFEYSRPYGWWLFGGFVTGLIRMVLPLYMPVFVKNVIDRVLLAQGLSPEQRLRILWGMLPLFLIILGLHSVATLGRFYWPNIAASSAIRDIRVALFDHLQRLSLSFHQVRRSGSIVSRLITDVSTAQNIFDVFFIQTSQCILQAVVIGGFLFYRDWQWAMVSLVTVPIYVVTVRLVRKPMYQVSKEVLETSSRISGRMTERMSMIREVQSFTAEMIERRQIRGEADTLRTQALRQQLLNSIVVGASEITRITGLVAILFFGVYRVLSGHASIGDVTAFYLYAGMLLGPIEFLSNLYVNLQVGSAAASRIFEFFDTQSNVREKPRAPLMNYRHPPQITFEHVSFTYPGHKDEVLKDLHLEVEPGKMVVLVGESGAGKTTLMSLLPRFFDPVSGRILIDNQDIRDVKLRSLRQTIGIVPQEPVLFNGTIRENILYGRPGADEKGIVAAAQSANADIFIRGFPKGYDTIVGERGVGLSGGQVQRLAIARAFLKNPAIMIMDEATSNLDSATESLVLDALGRLARGRTTFVIAHRLSIAPRADLIIVMDKGCIVEKGNHQELMSAKGLYSSFWEKGAGTVSMHL